MTPYICSLMVSKFLTVTSLRVFHEVNAKMESIAQTSIPHVPLRMASRRMASEREN